MTVTFTRERWATYRAECDELWREHYDELALRKSHMQMKPDEEAYRALDQLGILDIVVARDGPRMVGYVISVVRRHMHYADVLVGYEDAYFLAKSHRHGLTGLRLLQAWVAAMRARKVALLFAMTKPWLDMSPLFKRLGFTLSDLMYSLWIGPPLEGNA